MKTKMKEKNQKLTFDEILNSPFRYLAENLEWGSSGPDLMEYWNESLRENTGYDWPVNQI